jgi:alanyl-tRNA synthetase
VSSSPCIGRGPNGEPIVNGAEVFKLTDTVGYPLELVTLSLRERGLGFDVPGFMRAARLAGWSQKRTLARILEGAPPAAHEITHFAAERTWRIP